MSYRHIVLLAIGFISPQAFAGQLVVDSADTSVVIAVNGQITGHTPLNLDLPAGQVKVGVRTGTLAEDVMVETVDVPAEGVVHVLVNVPMKRAKVSYGDGSAQPDAVFAAPEGAVPPEWPTGEVFVTSPTEGASVFLDGKDLDLATPAMLEKIPVGPHKLTVRTECARAESDIEVAEGRILRAELNPVPGLGKLEITSTPAGAVAFVDDVEVGATPVTLSDVACGPHKVELRAAGFLEAEQSVRVPAYDVSPLHVDLVKETFGTLVVKVKPLTAEVWLDGIGVGSGPNTLEQVATGPHELKVKLPGYQDHVATIDVLLEGLTRIDVELAPGETAPAKDKAKKVSSETTVPRERELGPRIVLNSAATAVGVAGLAVGTYEYLGARKDYNRFLEVPDDAEAERIYNEAVQPRAVRSYVELGVGGALTAGSVLLWVTTDFTLAPTLDGVVLRGRF